MKKFLGIVIFIAVIIFAGWAYMNSGVPANPQPEPTVSPEVTVQPTPEEVVTPQPTPEEEKRLSAKGVYIGLADSNFIEIMINDKYVSAKLSPSLKASFDNLNIEEEDNVTIEYTLEKGVYEVHKISKN
ncbi:MAG: hypothetical protein IJY55_01065 [Clostridia bacterium]|nr:hypothetical protein [Clostridia bacterium]